MTSRAWREVRATLATHLVFATVLLLPLAAGACFRSPAVSSQEDASATVKLIVASQEGPSPPKSRINDPIDSSGATLLHVAAAFGSERWTGDLLNAGADPGVSDSLGELPIHLAAQNGNPTVVAMLGEHKGGIAANRYGWTPLHFACALGNAEAANILLTSLRPEFLKGLRRTLLAGDTLSSLATLAGVDSITQQLRLHGMLRGNGEPEAVADRAERPVGSEPIVVLTDVGEDAGVRGAIWPDGFGFYMSASESAAQLPVRLGFLSSEEVERLLARLAESGLLDVAIRSYGPTHDRIRRLDIVMQGTAHRFELGAGYEAYKTRQEYATLAFLRFCTAWKLMLLAIQSASDSLPRVSYAAALSILERRTIGNGPVDIVSLR
jgi:hypothetical protein